MSTGDDAYRLTTQSLSQSESESESEAELQSAVCTYSVNYVKGKKGKIV